MTLKAFEDFLLKIWWQKKHTEKFYILFPLCNRGLSAQYVKSLKMLEFTIQGCIILLIYLDVFYTSSPFIAHCRSLPYLSVYFKQLPALLCQVLHFAKYISSKLPKGLKLQNSKLKSCSNYLVLLFRPWIYKLSSKWVHK